MVKFTKEQDAEYDRLLRGVPATSTPAVEGVGQKLDRLYKIYGSSLTKAIVAKSGLPLDYDSLDYSLSFTGHHSRPETHEARMKVLKQLNVIVDVIDRLQVVPPAKIEAPKKKKPIITFGQVFRGLIALPVLPFILIKIKLYIEAEKYSWCCDQHKFLGYKIFNWIKNGPRK
jgi:hypothetical protein